MIAKSVPGQLSNQPVILMRVFPTVREHKIRREGLFQILKNCFYVRSDKRHKAVREAPEDNPLAARCINKPRDGLLCLCGTNVDGAEHDPVEDAVLPLRGESQDRSTATDFDVVRMATQAQYPQLSRRARVRFETQHVQATFATSEAEAMAE